MASQKVPLLHLLPNYMRIICSMAAATYTSRLFKTNAFSLATLTSWRMLSSLLIPSSLFPILGTTSFVSGICPLESQHVVSSATPKTCSPSPFQSTTVRSCRPLVTEPSNSGMPLENANTLSKTTTLTLNGSAIFVSFQTVTNPPFVLASWDKTVKVWNLTNCRIRNTLIGHTGYVNTVAVSPYRSLCASGGKDAKALLWDLAEGKQLYSLDASAVIHSLCFNPNRYWLCAATEQSIKIWGLESKSIVEDVKVDLN